MRFVNHQQRPRIRTEIFRHLFHDRLQDGVEIQRRRQRFRDVVEDGEFLAVARQLSAGGLGHAGNSSYPLIRRVVFKNYIRDFRGGAMNVGNRNP